MHNPEWVRKLYPGDRESQIEELGNAAERLWDELTANMPHELCHEISDEVAEKVYNVLAGREPEVDLNAFFREMREKYVTQEINRQLGVS